MLGAIYVSVAIFIPSYYPTAAINQESMVIGQTCELAKENQRSDRYSGRLPGPTRLPESPEYIDDKPVKYQLPPSPSQTRGKKVTKKAATEEMTVSYPPNYILIWTVKWCDKCRLMKELGDKLESDGFDVFYIDFDSNQEEARANNIAALPTAVIYTNAEEVRRIIGMSRQIKEEVETRIREVLEKNEKEHNNYGIY
jgi:thiol-disulfide isomerase/thioredoxin